MNNHSKLLITILLFSIFILPLTAEAEEEKTREKSADEVLYEKGTQYLVDKKEYDKAIETFKELATVHLTSYLYPNSLYNLGCAYYYNEDYENAIAIFKRLIKEHSDLEIAEDAQLDIGGCLRRMDKFKEAIVVYEEFLKKYPKSKQKDTAFYGIGFCYYYMKVTGEQGE